MPTHRRRLEAVQNNLCVYRPLRISNDWHDQFEQTFLAIRRNTTDTIFASAERHVGATVLSKDDCARARRFSNKLGQLPLNALTAAIWDCLPASEEEELTIEPLAVVPSAESYGYRLSLTHANATVQEERTAIYDKFEEITGKRLRMPPTFDVTLCRSPVPFSDQEVNLLEAVLPDELTVQEVTITTLTDPVQNQIAGLQKYC